MAVSQRITLDQLPAALAEIERPLRKEFKPLLNAISVYIWASIRKRFHQGVSPDGQPWKPLKGKRPRGGNKPLRDRNILMLAATGGAGSFKKIGETYLEQGVNLIQARTHQEGGTIIPKGAKALAVPLTRAAYGKPPRAFGRPLTLIWPKGKAHGWLIEETGKGKRRKSVMHYLLIPKAVIPARPFMGFNREDIDKIELMIVDYVTRSP